MTTYLVYRGPPTPMPAGALVSLDMSQYAMANTLLGYVPNSVTAAAPSLNMVTAPRRSFNNSALYVFVGMTITDANATGADGAANGASTIAGENQWYIQPASCASGRVFPAGDYTLAVNLRWKGTGSASFQMGPALTPFTAPDTTMRRYAVTFTADGVSSYGCLIYRYDAATVADWEIDFFNIFSGSVDLGPTSNDDGNLYFAPQDNGALMKYPVGGGVIDFTSAYQMAAMISLPSTVSLGAFSVTFVIRKTGSTGNFMPILAKNGIDWRKFAVGVFLNGPAAYHNDNGLTDETSSDNWFRTDATYRIGVYTFDGSVCNVYVDGTLVRSFPAVDSSLVAIRDLAVNKAQNATNSSFKLQSLDLYPLAFTQAQVSAATASLRYKAITAGVTPTAFSKIVFFEGNSITYGSNDALGDEAGGYAHRVSGLTSTPIIGGNYSHSGSTVGAMTDRAAALDAVLPVSKAGRIYVLHIFIGANDLNGATGGPSAFLTALLAYINARRTAGWDKIVVGTIIDRDWSNANTAQSAADRLSANTTIRSWFGTTIDALSDFAADARFTPDSTAANANNTTYFEDKVHPTVAGHTLMAAIAAAAIDSV